MSTRRRLPNRRAAETFEIEVGGLRYTATVGRFADGTIGEVFLNNHKSNSAADVNARGRIPGTACCNPRGARAEEMELTG